MANYNFDKIVNRRGSGAIKCDDLASRYGREDLIPLWVADMDFETPPFVVEALRQRLQHPVFGYTMMPADYWQVVTGWIEEHHRWKVNEEWITYIPGIVRGIGLAVNCFVKPDEKVIIQPPVYHPFRLTPEGNGREVVFNPLREEPDGTYSMDFENLEQVIDDKCRMLILSNPHNPAGLVWSRETLQRLAEICHRHHLIVISDEIHGDMALYGHRHVPFASVSPQAAEIGITFGAPSKTFNIAGIVSSYAIVPNQALREPFYNWLSANELNEPTLFSSIATLAAFTPEGEEWRKQMLRYVEGNVDYVVDFCARKLPQIKPLRPQASFLIWLDCRALGLSQPELTDLFVNKARLALNDGEIFGKEGIGFMRLNVGEPRSVIEQAMEQLYEAIENL